MNNITNNSTSRQCRNSRREKAEEESRDLLSVQEQKDIVSLRTYIRSICNRLIKHFKDFIDVIDVEGVVNNNFGLFDIRDNNNNREYPTIEDFLQDIDLLHKNIKSSANMQSLKARQFINESCHLQDTALSMSCQVDRELAARCKHYKNKNSKNNNNNKNKQKTKKFKVNSKEEDRLQIVIVIIPTITVIIVITVIITTIIVILSTIIILTLIIMV